MVWIRWRWGIFGNLTKFVMIQGCIKVCKYVNYIRTYLFIYTVYSSFKHTSSNPPMLSFSFLEYLGYFGNFCFSCLLFLPPYWGMWQPEKTKDTRTDFSGKLPRECYATWQKLAKSFVKTPFAKAHLCHSILTDPFAKPNICHNMAKVMAKVMALPPLPMPTQIVSPRKNWESLARRRRWLPEFPAVLWGTLVTHKHVFSDEEVVKHMTVTQPPTLETYGRIIRLEWTYNTTETDLISFNQFC